MYLVNWFIFNGIIWMNILGFIKKNGIELEEKFVSEEELR